MWRLFCGDNRVKEEKINWTKEQIEIIGKMIEESEAIGWTQGYDESTKDLIIELEKFILELKKRIYRR